MDPLPTETLQHFKTNYPDWKDNNGKLEAHFKFKDFISAFSFLNGIALLSEKRNHHPEIYNVYNKVTLKLSTHDAGEQITDKDLELAEEISNFYNR